MHTIAERSKVVYAMMTSLPFFFFVFACIWIFNISSNSFSEWVYTK